MYSNGLIQSSNSESENVGDSSSIEPNTKSISSSTYSSSSNAGVSSSKLNSNISLSMFVA